ncbi:unnamed protein product [Protopolystoma xenopodis]|uniref:Uncharacterized protein n=1 Tax=Protopolystoma xenopodis TaxID=117903 RepID=A0A448WGS5_9PLAT|nr:unnamed protein product [Protopolystoma xenopodis]
MEISENGIRLNGVDGAGRGMKVEQIGPFGWWTAVNAVSSGINSCAFASIRPVSNALSLSLMLSNSGTIFSPPPKSCSQTTA